jgi:putative peptidoglycan lipid II flippase
MEKRGKHPLITGARATAAGTLASRILGLVRDMATAAVLGMSGSPVADAFVLAFRLPNLFRRLFGEGALTASYLPVFTQRYEVDRGKAWQLASVLFTWLTLFLGALTVLSEIVLALIGWTWSDSPSLGLLMRLSAAMLPYMTLICLAAQIAATLQAVGKFSVPAWTPALLNVSMILAAWLVAPRFAGSRETQAFVLAIAVLVGGIAQVLAQLPLLRRMGFQFDYRPTAVREDLRRIGYLLAPMVLGLAVTQVNTFSDSVIAWIFESHTPADSTNGIGWLGGVPFPMRQGAATALYYGERLYEFPLGIVGVAVATAIFPLLSRHAARGDREQLGADLTLGLRMVLALSVPAGVGLIVLAGPLVHLLFERGQFTAIDSARAAATTAYFALGVWAYCAAPVVVRGFYALDDSRTPVRVGVWIVGLDLSLGLALIWPLGERGLALSTTLSAIAQLLLLLWLFARKYAALEWKSLSAAALRTALASLAMAAVCCVALEVMPEGSSFASKSIRVVVPVIIGALTYIGLFHAIGGREIAMLWTGDDDR